MSRLTPGAHIIPICTVAELPELECTGGYRVLAAGRNYYAARQPFGILSYVIADSVRLVVLGAEMVEQHISSSSERIRSATYRATVWWEQPASSAASRSDPVGRTPPECS